MSFVDGLQEGQELIPILGAGHFNLTKQNITNAISKSKYLLVGFSSYACHKCISVEQEYANLTKLLDTLDKSKYNVQFARFDVALKKQIPLEYGAQELPSLVMFQKGRAATYRGTHSSTGIFNFVKKLIGSPVTRLDSVDQAQSFLNGSVFSDGSVGWAEDRYTSLSTVMVVGFFSAHKDMEEDEYDEFMQAAKQLQSKEDIYFGEVVHKAVSRAFMAKKLIDRTPAVLLLNRETGDQRSLNLDDFYEKVSLSEWILRNAIPLVGRLTGTNFQMYEKIGRPMLMMFLDLSEASLRQSVVQGRSGGIPNEDLLDEFRVVAKEHQERILFVYLDGVEHDDRMKSLGLYGGKERLPSIAFNTREGSQLPFPEELPVNRDTLLRFCAEFISGKLKSVNDTKEMARKALQSVIPISQKNKATRQDVKKPPEVVRGISEAWGDGSRGDLFVIPVSAATFDEQVMQQWEDKDVVLLLHAQNCEPCAHFAVYFKKMAERFSELAIPSLVISRMDVTSEAPHSDLGLMVGKLPLLVMMPAGMKYPPWIFYSGVGKMQMMMKWVQHNAALSFELPNLPHLNEEDVVRFKEQVREREEYMEKQRQESAKAMEDEDRRRLQYEESKGGPKVEL